MPRNHNMGTSTLRNRNRVTNKTRLKIVHGSIDADALLLDEDEERARVVSTAGVDAEDANEHHLQAVLSAASQRQQVTSRATRGASTEKAAPAPAAYIPTPDSTGLVDNYDELYPSGRWTQPDAYIRFSETVEESVSTGLNDSFSYFMDERDKEWLDRNNEEARGEGTSLQGAVSTGATTRSCPQRSAKAKGKEPESVQAVAITEDEFELVMGIFERVTHDKTEFLHHGLESGMAFPPFTDYQDVFSSPLTPSLFATFTIPTWIPPPVQLLRLAKIIYPYWRERRTDRGGHRIIPILNFDEADLNNESYICFRRREIKSVRKTRASQATSSDKLLRLQAELAQSLELAKTLLARESLKKDNAQQVVQVWEKRLEFAEIKRKHPGLNTKEDEELLHDKDRVVKKPRIESTSRIGLKLRTRESGDSGSPALQAEASLRPRERLTLINAAVERDLTRRKERDHGYEDIVENPYQRPSLPYSRRYWKPIPLLHTPSLSSDSEEGDLGHLRYLRRRVTRLGGSMVDRREAFMRRLGFLPDDVPLYIQRNPTGSPKDPSEEEEDIRTLRERWRFDRDDEPLVAPEGVEEQDRILIDDYDTKYLRHMMTLLTEADQQYINNDPTLVLVSAEGRQQTVLPFKTGTQQPFIRRDPQTQRPFPNGTQLTAPRPLTSVPLSTVPNGVPIAMQTPMKALQPQSAPPRISHSAAMRPPGPPPMMNMIPAIPLTQTSPPPHSAPLSAPSANGTVSNQPYVGHLVPNGNHYNMQVAASTNMNVKLASGRQWNGVVSPLQQTASLGNQHQQDGNAAANTSPTLNHANRATLPVRTPSANDMRNINRPGVTASVGHMMPSVQYTTHSLSPRIPNAVSSPLPNPSALPSHQSPPRPSLTPAVKITSPSLQHQQTVPNWGISSCAVP